MIVNAMSFAANQASLLEISAIIYLLIILKKFI